MRKQSATEIEKLDRWKRPETKEQKVHLCSLKNPVLWIREPEKFEQQVTHKIQIFIRKHEIRVKQAVMNRNSLDWISVGEKSNVDIINEEVKGSSSEEEEIVILKFKRRSHVDIMNE